MTTKNQEKFLAIQVKNLVDYSYNFKHVFSGSDQLGEKEDLEFFDNTPACSMYDCIRFIEHMTINLNIIVLRHMVNLFDNDETYNACMAMTNKPVSPFYNVHDWLAKIKLFYIYLLSNEALVVKLLETGFEFKEIQTVVKMVIELELIMEC